VSHKSPAFKLIASFARTIGADPGLESWRGPAQDLYKIFEQRKASPHDRLLNGQTLLHVCTPVSLRRYTNRNQVFLCPDHNFLHKRYTLLAHELLLHG
jgi:hypothetical protein